MLKWAVIFLVLTIITATMGFGGIPDQAANIATFLFFAFMIAFISSLVLGLDMNHKSYDHENDPES
jgi:uncharacterized membrane protein YtjA (UPF0391 family)